MKLNEKSVASFAVCSSPIDKEGYLSKKGDVNKGLQRRWFVLKGNLLFYFEKKQDKEPQGVIVLEACSVQASVQARYSFEISFDGQGTRTYILVADNDEDMQSWMKVISHASYEYLRSIVDEMQRRVNLLTSSSKTKGDEASGMSLLHVGPAKAISTSLTLPKGSGSKATAKVKVQNGILVDVDEEAPPVPPKMKSQTIHSFRGKPSLQPSSSYDTPPQIPDVPPIPAKQRTTYQMRTLPPHSSPVVTPTRLNPEKPLSPTATLDRTPVLEPTLLSSSDDKPPPRPPKPGTSETGAAGLHPFEMGSIPPPQRQVAAPPLDTKKKSIYEMHEEFTQAMQALRSERTAS